jgi:hypothetical protein
MHNDESLEEYFTRNKDAINFSIKEICQVTGLTKHQVRAIIKKFIILMRERMDEYWEDYKEDKPEFVDL